MHFIETKHFLKQLHELTKRYRKIAEDFSQFKDSELREGGSEMQGNVWKYRWRNSSIPVGKRGGLRFIVWIDGDIVIPLSVYAKTVKENMTAREIEDAMEQTIRELRDKPKMCWCKSLAFIYRID